MKLIILALLLHAALCQAAVEPTLVHEFDIVNFTFPTSQMRDEYLTNKYYEGVMITGIKISSAGDTYVSIPR